MTLDEAKAAIREADKHFRDANEDTNPAPITVGNEQMPILFGTDWGVWNYGAPNTYPMSLNDVAALRRWWEEYHPTNGRLLKPQRKAKGVFGVNLQWVANDEMLFNFHLRVV